MAEKFDAKVAARSIEKLLKMADSALELPGGSIVGQRLIDYVSDELRRLTEAQLHDVLTQLEIDSEKDMLNNGEGAPIGFVYSRNIFVHLMDDDMYGPVISTAAKKQSAPLKPAASKAKGPKAKQSKAKGAKPVKSAKAKAKPSKKKPAKKKVQGKPGKKVKPAMAKKKPAKKLKTGVIARPTEKLKPALSALIGPPQLQVTKPIKVKKAKALKQPKPAKKTKSDKQAKIAKAPKPTI